MIALILGRANSVWDDVDQAQHLLGDRVAVVIAVNGVGCDYKQHIDHWVSFHPELFPDWIRKRRNNGYSDGYQLWTTRRGRKLSDWDTALGLQDLACEGGSSGMIGLQVALRKIDANKIMLAGIPLDDKYGHYDTPGPWDEASMHRKAWMALPSEDRVKIRSLSGWTRQWFGYPTEDWLNE